MAYWVGAAFGGLVLTYLLTRLGLWLTKKMGDNQRRIWIVYAVTFALTVVLGGLGFADGGPPRFVFAAAIYGGPLLLWLVIDFLALKGRRATAMEAQPLAPDGG